MPEVNIQLQGLEVTIHLKGGGRRGIGLRVGALVPDSGEEPYRPTAAIALERGCPGGRYRHLPGLV